MRVNRYIGSPIERLEDPSFLRGTATYVGDLSHPGLLYAAISSRAISSTASFEAGALRAVIRSSIWALAVKAASSVAPGGHVTAVDVSPEMLDRAQRWAIGLGLSNITFVEDRGRFPQV
jgi:hypothetical protein